MIFRNPSILTPEVRDSRAEILSLLVQASSDKAGGALSIRFEAVLRWVNVAVKWSDVSATEAYRTALQILEALIASGSSLESRHTRLTSARGSRTDTLSVDGAACAIASGNPELALELLEQGRSMLLAQAGKYRTRVDDLKALYPALAEEFQTISRNMEASVMEIGRPIGGQDFALASGDPISE